MGSYLKKLAGQTAIYGLSSIIGRLLNYLLVPLYVSVFAHTSDYGVISELYAWIAFLMVLLTFGMETAFFKYLSDRPEKKDKIFRNALLSVILVNVVFYCLVLIFCQSIADLMLYSENPEFILLLGTIVFLDAVSALPLAKLRAEEKAKKFAVIQLIGIGINIGLNLIFMLILFNPDIQNAAVGIRYILWANIIASLVKPLALYNDYLQLKWKWDFTLIRSMVKYSIPLAIAGFAFIINETIDRILLKYLSYDAVIDGMTHQAALTYAESQVGIYSASYKLAMLITLFLQAYRYAAEPFFFNEAKSKNRNEIYVKVMNYFIAIVFFFFLIVSLNIDIFKYFIPNEAYWEGLKVIPILLLANVCLGIYINMSIWYKLSGQTKYGAYISIIGAIATLTLLFVFIPKYGYIACAWTTLFVYFGEMVLSYFLCQKHYPIPYNVKRFGLYSILAIALFLGAKWLAIEPGVFQFFVHNCIVVAFVVFVVFMERSKLNFVRKK